MRTGRTLVVFAAVFAVWNCPTREVLACPACGPPQVTLSEQVAQSDAVALVQWVAAEKPAGQSAGSTTFEVVRVVKGPRPIADAKESKLGKRGEEPGRLEKGQRITLVRYRAGKAGDLFLLMGTMGSTLDWNSPLEVTETSFNYISQAPSPEMPEEKRLAYFLKFLEFSDPLIAADAYFEFARAPYEALPPIVEQIPVEKVRQWVASPDTPATRLGLYGLMLGLCGNEEDAKAMEQKITESTQEFRLGIDGVMFGYLLLTGEEGLEVLDKAKLKDNDAPFSETYAAMQALRYMWSYGGGKIPKQRLRQSMRLLLDRPELADLVIADLARWQDWLVQDRLMDLYGAGEYDIPSIKRAVIRYLLVCSKDLPTGDNVEVPLHAALAKKRLDALREKDPKTVREAERFFLPN